MVDFQKRGINVNAFDVDVARIMSAASQAKRNKQLMELRKLQIDQAKAERDSKNDLLTVIRDARSMAESPNEYISEMGKKTLATYAPKEKQELEKIQREQETHELTQKTNRSKYWKEQNEMAMERQLRTAKNVHKAMVDYRDNPTPENFYNQLDWLSDLGDPEQAGGPVIDLPPGLLQSWMENPPAPDAPHLTEAIKKAEQTMDVLGTPEKRERKNRLLELTAAYFDEFTQAEGENAGDLTHPTDARKYADKLGEPGAQRWQLAMDKAEKFIKSEASLRGGAVPAQSRTLAESEAQLKLTTGLIQEMDLVLEDDIKNLWGAEATIKRVGSFLFGQIDPDLPPKELKEIEGKRARIYSRANNALSEFIYGKSGKQINETEAERIKSIMGNMKDMSYNEFMNAMREARDIMQRYGYLNLRIIEEGSVVPMAREILGREGTKEFGGTTKPASNVGVSNISMDSIKAKLDSDTPLTEQERAFLKQRAGK